MRIPPARPQFFRGRRSRLMEERVLGMIDRGDCQLAGRTERDGGTQLIVRGEHGMCTAMAHKDPALMLEVRQELGVPLLAIPAAHTAYEIAPPEGMDRLDYASISTRREKWNGVKFSAGEDRA